MVKGCTRAIFPVSDCCDGNPLDRGEDEVEGGAHGLIFDTAGSEGRPEGMELLLGVDDGSLSEKKMVAHLCN